MVHMICNEKTNPFWHGIQRWSKYLWSFISFTKIFSNSNETLLIFATTTSSASHCNKKAKAKMIIVVVESTHFDDIFAVMLPTKVRAQSYTSTPHKIFTNSVYHAKVSIERA